MELPKKDPQSFTLSLILILSVSLTIMTPLQSVLATPTIAAQSCDPETGTACPAVHGNGPPTQEPIVRLTNFRPELHGFKFSNNDFVNQIVVTVPMPGTNQAISIETETKGRSGGMAYAALDFFFNNMTIPNLTDVPLVGDVLTDYISRRLLDSFLAPTAANYVDWSFRTGNDTLLRDGTLTLTNEEIPKIMREIDEGRPAVIGLVNADIPFGDISQLREVGSANHQVIAYGYRDYPTRGIVEFLIYDNNEPNKEVILKIDDLLGSQIKYTIPNPGGNVTTTSSWKGLFLHNYLGPMTPPYIPPQLGEITINRIEPASIMAGESTNITVDAIDSVDSTPVDGNVIIDGVGIVGRTNTPFSFTFSSNASYVTGRVTAQGHADAALVFPLTFPLLEVRADPSTIEINNETQVTIYAVDPKTNASVTGQVVTNTLSRDGRPVIIGNTSEQFTHTFIPARGESVILGDKISYEPAYPTVTVVAPGYSDTVVTINFTGQLPTELIPPPLELVPPLEESEDLPDPMCIRPLCTAEEEEPS